MFVEVKEDQEQQRLMVSPGSSAGEGPPSMKETLHSLLRRLMEKRTEASRPEDLEVRRLSCVTRIYIDLEIAWEDFAFGWDGALTIRKI